MKKKKGHLGLSNSFHYTLMVLPGYIWLFMFSIVPMVGIVMAFQDYNPSKGWFGSPWVGMKWFKYLTVIPDAKRALVNTLIIAIAKVILNIIIPLVFALLLNEVKNMKFKKTVQTIVYLPHFVSWVILANIITNILGANGIFNTVRSAFGATDTVLPMTIPGIFRQLLIGTDVWKEFGYNAVIYLAALTGISPSLYEAAAEDGLVTVYPIGPNVKSYNLIMGDSAFWNSFWISIKRVVIGTVWTMVVLIMMSYPLAKSKTEYKPRNVLMWILVFCMLFNGGTIPWFITVKNYGMIDTMAALVLAGSVPVFNVLLMMNFFRGIPGDLEEAARVDGAGPWRILWQIVVPCSKPVIATIVLFTSVGYWNEYFQGLVLMNKETNYPLQTYIRQISVQIPVGVTLTAEQYQQLAQNSNKSLEAAKVFIALVPMLIVYPFLQKYFVTGITLGAVKE